VDLIGNWKGLVKAIIFAPLLFIEYLFFLLENHRRYEVVLMSGFTEKILFSPLAKIFGLRVFWIEFGPMDSLLSKFGGLPKILYNLVKNIPQKVVVSSSNTLKKVAQNPGFKKNQLVTIPCGRNLKLKKRDSQKTRKNKVICCVSRLEKGKGQDYLLKAFAKLQKKISRVEIENCG
jgi:glycosyltransferase involved in cell wall biosynthesis